MDAPNQAISIYDGTFELHYDEQTFIVEGAILYKWHPEPSVFFSGIASISKYQTLTISNIKPKIFINGLRFSDAIITHTTYSDPIQIEGIAIKNAIIGDPSIQVKTIDFSILNLRSFLGSSTYTNDENGLTFSKSRLTFESRIGTIYIDELYDSENRNKLLKGAGGYIMLYAGRFCSKEPVACNDTLDFFECFSQFLTFLNGRRCSAIFRKGVNDESILWQDFSSYKTDLYKPATTWPARHDITGIEACWKNFYTLWQDSNSKDFINMAIHWYIEASSNAAYVEGSIIIAQTALELIYNWLLVEQQKLLRGDDARNISASNKIRLLLSHIGLSSDIPNKLKDLYNFSISFKDSKRHLDGPEAITLIRNALIHSQHEKRRELTQISNAAKYQALQLALKYIELCLLKILAFQGSYFNRVSGAEWEGDGEENVPWMK
jgi:hypothetical protein